MVLSIIFLEDKHKILLHLSIFYEYEQFFQHRICFSIQPPDYSDPWPTLTRSASFFLIMLFNKIILWFLQGSNIYKLWENYTEICCPFLARLGTGLAVIREITPIKSYNFRIKSEKCVQKLYSNSRTLWSWSYGSDIYICLTKKISVIIANVCEFVFRP